MAALDCGEHHQHQGGGGDQSCLRAQHGLARGLLYRRWKSGSGHMAITSVVVSFLLRYARSAGRKLIRMLKANLV
jgi:hypothetical protein